MAAMTAKIAMKIPGQNGQCKHLGNQMAKTMTADLRALKVLDLKREITLCPTSRPGFSGCVSRVPQAASWDALYQKLSNSKNLPVLRVVRYGSNIPG